MPVDVPLQILPQSSLAVLHFAISRSIVTIVLDEYLNSKTKEKFFNNTKRGIE